MSLRGILFALCVVVGLKYRTPNPGYFLPGRVA